MAEFQLRTEIVALSVANNWEEAVREWELSDIYISDRPDACLCGHYPIKEICELVNKRNGNQTQVGNCCVNKFLGLESEKLFSSLRRIRLDAEKSLSEEVIEWAYDKEIINSWERKFYYDVFRKRKLSEKQAKTKRQINAKVLARVMR